jgi:uncharacterized membrane protein YccC
VYIVFLNTRTRGDAIQRGYGRLLGTFCGLFGGLAIAAVATNAAAEGAIMLLAVFATYYFYAVSYTTAMFCVTVLLGMLYGAMGAPLEPLLLLRLEETALGVTAAVLAAIFIWPVPTSQQVRISSHGVLRALRDVVQSSLSVTDAGGSLAAIEAVRRLDRQIGDLRLALQPLTAGRFILRRALAERPLTALLACSEAARALAAACTQLPIDRTHLLRQAGVVEARLDAALAGAKPPELTHVVEAVASENTAEAALKRLNVALAMLSERLGDSFG